MSGERINDQCEMGDELFFTAVRYALDELSANARDAFEQRLLVDQDARECLAEAVAICQRARAGMDPAAEPAIAAGLRTVDSRNSVESERRSILWTCLALAASLLLAVGLWGFGKRGDMPLVEKNADETGRQLAVAWLTSGEWVDVDDGPLGVAGHERRVPADERFAERFADDRFSDEVDQADDEVAWLEGGAEPPSADAANDWLFEAVTAPPAPAIHREG